MRKKRLTNIIISLVLITLLAIPISTYGSPIIFNFDELPGGAEGHETFSEPTLIELVVDASNIEITTEQSNQIHLTAYYYDSTTEDVTAKAVWESTNENIATVHGGLVTGIKEGSTEITASYDDGIVRVLVQVNENIENFSDENSSELPKEPIEEQQNNFLMGSGLGLLNEEDTMGLFAEPTLVALEIDHQSPVKIEKNQSRQLTLTALYSDESTMDVTAEATWESGNETVATVIGGLVTGIGSGNTTITVNYGEITKKITVQVSLPVESLMVVPSNVLLPVGKTQTISVTAVDENGTEKDVSLAAEIRSSSPAISSVTGNLLKAVARGETIVSVTYGGITEEINVKVTAPLSKLEASTTNLGIAVGDEETVQFTATFGIGETENVTDQVILTSSNTRIVDITGGKIIAKTRGTATITATYGGKSLRINVKVTAPVSILDVDYTDVILIKGRTQAVRVTAIYTDNKVENVSSYASIISNNTEIVTVSGYSIKAVKEGSTTLTVRYGGVTKTVNVYVRPYLTKLEADTVSITLVKNNSSDINLWATYQDSTYENVTNMANWNSSNAQIATVYKGFITAKAKGTANITATFLGKNVNIKIIVIE